MFLAEDRVQCSGAGLEVREVEGDGDRDGGGLVVGLLLGAEARLWLPGGLFCKMFRIWDRVPWVFSILLRNSAGEM